ncbi:MAG: hypothetical protein KAJ58_01935 [Candidatus Pacebacteria bacterium]|nr:hypothetical protein [Candidatus Paceibacterota bacterium]
MNLIYIIIAAIIGYIIGKNNSSKTSQSQISPFEEMDDTELEKMQTKTKETISQRTEERKEKILEYIKKEKAHQEALANCSIEERKEGVDRKEIEDLLDISRSTALKYLNELEKEQKITQSSPTGRTVHYTIN